VVISIVAVVVVIFLTVKVVPTFVGLIETNGSAAALPLPTRIVIGFSSFIRFKWYILVIAIVAITIIIRYILSTTEGRYKFDRFKLKKQHIILYILLWSLIAVGFECIGIKLGVYHYDKVWKIQFSFPSYLAINSILLALYYKLCRQKEL
jgi:hypothetical protein